MADIGFSISLRNARAQQLIDKLDAAATPGAFLLYTAGSGRPATGGAITDQVLLGTIGLSQPCATIDNGILTFATFTEDPIADATGEIFFARGVDGDGNFVIDVGCSLSTDPNPKTLLFNTLNTQAGGVIQILSGALTEGNA